MHTHPSELLHSQINFRSLCKVIRIISKTINLLSAMMLNILKSLKFFRTESYFLIVTHTHTCMHALQMQTKNGKL